MGSTRTDRPLLDAVRAGVLVVDGAMGSQLYERGVLYSACFEELNVSRPELVAKVHEDYVRAGAQVIETNTFGANALRLEKYGLSSRVQELNAAGVRVARAAAGTQAYVVGAIGPSGYFLGEAGRDTGSEDLAKVKAVFLEQARALLEGGVDALVVETIRQTPELRAAVEAAVEASEGRVPVIASASLDENGPHGRGHGGRRRSRAWRASGARASSASTARTGRWACSRRSSKMVPVGLPVLASPNAGLPRRVDERMVYVSTPEYFGVYARRMFRVGRAARRRLLRHDARAHPAHRGRGAHGRSGRRRRGRARRRTTSRAIADVTVTAARDLPGSMHPTPLEQRSELAAKIARGRFVVSVEVNPPIGLDPVAGDRGGEDAAAPAASTSSTSPTARARRRA